MFENFNRGIGAARGEYLTFCHDDDLVVPEFLARQVAFLDAHPTAGFSGSNYATIDDRGAVVETRSPVRRTELWSGRRYIRTLLRTGRNPLTMQSIFYRRSALPPGGIDLALPIHYGDFVLLMRIAETHDVGLAAWLCVLEAMHMATGVGTPVVALFGPTVRQFGFFPYHVRAAVLERDLGCRPCSSKGGPACPLGHHRCLREITPETVVTTLCRILT